MLTLSLSLLCNSNLGIDDMYFASESVESIANHIMALYGAKIFAYTKNDNGLDINLERETEEGAVYIHTSRPGVSQLYGPQHEKRYATCKDDEHNPDKEGSGAWANTLLADFIFSAAI